MRPAIFRAFFLLACTAAAGCEHHKSYARDPLVREAKLTPNITGRPDSSTLAEPYPPPRPILPAEPAQLAELK